MNKKLSLLCLLLALTACGSDDTSGDKSIDKDKEAKSSSSKDKIDPSKNLICPQVAILQAGEEVFDYGGEKPDPSQLVAKARMRSIAGDCGYLPNGIDIAFTLHMGAKRGPRLGSGQVSFPYFIAIVDPAENVISRQIVTAQFSFADLDKTAERDDPLHVFIPLSEQSIPAGPAYRVLIGFQKPKMDGR
jgi:hypothetical protein